MSLGRLALTFVLLIVAAVAYAEPAPLQVAAASDLVLALPEIGQQFEKTTGRKLRFSFGSSGLLAHQIEHGAPFDLFFSANLEFVGAVVRAGVCGAESKRLYARGELVLYTPSGVSPPRTLADLRDPRFRKIAIARPEHAPYGRAAKEALLATKLWQTLLPRLIYGENIQQTLAFVESGNAEAALVARSLLMNVSGANLPIDAALHGPIDQALVICGDSEERKQAARTFADFVISPAGRKILSRYGFSFPSTTR
jgi:molybdate transport system substrate-binding protein